MNNNKENARYIVVIIRKDGRSKYNLTTQRSFYFMKIKAARRCRINYLLRKDVLSARIFYNDPVIKEEIICEEETEEESEQAAEEEADVVSCSDVADVI